MSRQFWIADAIESAKSDVFFHISDDLVILTEAYDEKTKQMGQLTFFEISHTGFPTLSVVDRGRFEDDLLYLEDGLTFEFDERANATHSAMFTVAIKDISREMREFFGDPTSPQEMDSRTLLALIKTMRANDIRLFSLETDYHFKFSIPAASFVFGIIGVLFSNLSPRRETASGVIFAIVCIAVYWVFMTVMRSLGHTGDIEPWFAAWGQNILFLFLGLPLIILARR